MEGRKELLYFNTLHAVFRNSEYSEIVDFSHPKFYHSHQREIIGTEKDNPERLEGHPQFY